MWKSGSVHWRRRRAASGSIRAASAAKRARQLPQPPGTPHVLSGRVRPGPCQNVPKWGILEQVSSTSQLPVGESKSGIRQTGRRHAATVTGGTLNQLALLPLESIEKQDTAGRGRLVRMPGRKPAATRTAVGAPGFLSVQAAAERLGLQPRSVRYLIEAGRLQSQRLGRMHFLPVGQVEGYRRARAQRSKRTLG